MEVEGSKVEGVRVIDRVFIGFDRKNTVLTLFLTIIVESSNQQTTSNFH